MTNQLAMISKAMETHMANNHGNSNQTVLMAPLERVQERDERREVAAAKRTALQNNVQCAMLCMLASINKELKKYNCFLFLLVYALNVFMLIN